MDIVIFLQLYTYQLLDVIRYIFRVDFGARAHRMVVYNNKNVLRSKIECKKFKLFVSVNKDDNREKCKGVFEAVYHKKCMQSNKQLLQTLFCDDCQKKARGSHHKTQN